MPSPPDGPPILRRLLEAAGYRLEDRSVGLLAVRSSDARAVLLVDGRRSPTEVMDEIPSGVIHRSLVYAEDPGSVARELASAHGLEILDASSIGPALGELLLPGPSAGTPPPASPSDPIEPPARIFPDGDQTVRARLDRRDAEAIAGVEGPRTTLRLIPFFVAPYRVRIATAQGTPGGVTDHLVAVHGLTGRVETWEAGERELSGAPPSPSNALPPVLSEEAARSSAELALRKRHTVSVDHTEQHGGAIVIERRRVAPGANDLRIGGMVLVHVPYWYIEGLEGRVIIDAVSGARAGPPEPDPSSD